MASVDPDYPIFVLAFCIFQKDPYAELIVPNLLKFEFKYFGHDQVALHERKIRKAGDEFAFLHDESIRTPFFDDLNTIIDESPFVLISSVIRKRKLKAKYPPAGQSI